ncbi:transglutaminase family protein [Aquincola sp. MAHUQ-54]|uniref:Transglutaminase family protein n=1 Tax=Aquincola agrisoli TaxID=3119538 RepID=A0AAW9QJY0_9BURK
MADTSRTFEIDCELNYEVQSPSTFVFKIEAAFTAEQSIGDETLTTLPALPIGRYTDPLGNRTLRVNVGPGPFSIRYRTQATVRRLPGAPNQRETPIAYLPLDVLPYLTGSRYVESELIFNDAVRWIGTTDLGFRRVERICQWVRENVKYEVGTSKPYGTARDVLTTRTGVCRDYAHVAIGLCRALNIPARFVVGHVEWDTPPPDFHALFEAWLDGRWVLFDPTEMADPLDVIRIGTGQDAADLPFATIFGNAHMTRMAPLVFRSAGTVT